MTLPDREHRWLPLLTKLTDTFPAWAVWKNIDSALHGKGDVDSLGPLDLWPSIIHVYADWAAEQGFGPVAVCRHEVPARVPGRSAGSQLHLLTVDGETPYVYQLDVKEQATFRGSTILDVWAMPELCAVDDRGVRIARPGLEGVLKMCLNGTRRGGQPDREALAAKRVRELLLSDPEGVELAAARFGPARDALMANVRAVTDGGWDRRSMLQVEAWSTLRSAADPGSLVGRYWYRKVVKPRCEVLQTLNAHDRRIDGDPAAWIRALAPGHDVIEVGA